MLFNFIAFFSETLHLHFKPLHPMTTFPSPSPQFKY